MRALILGAGGQLGEELARQVPGAMACERAALDVTDTAALRRVIEAERPEVVFNATSYNRVDAAETDPAPAFAVNVLAVRDMARLCAEFGSLLVHYSTNYAFGRDLGRRQPYTEDELPAPPNAYGVSKVLGEDFVRMLCPRHLVIRTAAVFGASRGSRANFLRNMQTAAKDRSLTIVNDQTIAPTATGDLVRATLHLLRTNAGGTFHVNGPDAATWYELARFYFEMLGLVDRVRPVTTEALGAAASRPRYSVLAIDKYLATGGPPPRRWHEAVTEYFQREARG